MFKTPVPKKFLLEPPAVCYTIIRFTPLNKILIRRYGPYKGKEVINYLYTNSARMAKFAVGGGSSLIFTLWGMDYHYNSEGITGPSQFIKDAVIYGFQEPNMEVRSKLRQLVIFYGYDLKDFLNESPDGRLASVDRQKVLDAYDDNYERMLAEGKASREAAKVLREAVLSEENESLKNRLEGLERKFNSLTVEAIESNDAHLSEKAKAVLRDLELENATRSAEAAAERPAVDTKEGLPYTG